MFERVNIVTREATAPAGVPRVIDKCGYAGLLKLFQYSRREVVKDDVVLCSTQ